MTTASARSERHIVENRLFDKQIDTNTDRDGYRDLMRAIENGKIKPVIASEVSRLCGQCGTSL